MTALQLNFLRARTLRELRIIVNDPTFCQAFFQDLKIDETCIKFQRSAHVTHDFIRRLGLEAELEGHAGCVNCLSWNEKGSLLASGSDDVQIIIWDALRHKQLTAIRTGHNGNIFSVKFLPQSGDNIVVSGAADCKIRVHEVNSRELLHVFSCHTSRVKRLATAPDQPDLFWSASEDGTIMQFDLRNPEMCKGDSPQNVLIDLNNDMGAHAEAKCLCINPLRTEQLAVGANDPYVRVYDRRMLHCHAANYSSDSGGFRNHQFTGGFGASAPSSPDEPSTPFPDESYRLPVGCVQYFVAGHLPQKQQDYKKKYRTLASTYVTYSPDGNELLVNLGGEQIYLFDVNNRRNLQRFDLAQLKGGASLAFKDPSYDPTSNGFTHLHTGSNGVAKHVGVNPAAINSKLTSNNLANKKSQYSGKPLPPAVEAIKQRANSVFEQQKYNQAILLYNQAIYLAPNLPILYGNRAAAFLKRNWDGDVYAALRDCYMAIRLDDNHIKAHFRLAKCLFELSWLNDSLECLQLFKAKFPDYANSSTCESLEKDIRAAICSKSQQEGAENKTTPGKGGLGSTRSHFSRWKDTMPDAISEHERKCREEANDYELRFCGHCNTTTDIKEANFFGSNGQFIVAGSDDGSFFIWDKKTTNIVQILRGDDSIVNCLEPHPTSCLLATSGIDPVVRLWSPRPEDGKKNDREVDNSDDAASANQKRMNADPLEVMLMNMGYRITGGLNPDEGNEGNGNRDSEGPVTCRSS